MINRLPIWCVAGVEPGGSARVPRRAASGWALSARHLVLNFVAVAVKLMLDSCAQLKGIRRGQGVSQ